MKQPYFKFSGRSVVKLAERLQRAGPDVATLQARVRGEGETETLDFRVLDKDGKAIGDEDDDEASTDGDDCGWLNDSRRCPPICD